MQRREFMLASLAALPVALVAAATRPSVVGGQSPQAGNPQTMTGPMDGSAHRPVRLQPKPNATPLLTADDIKTMELGLKCQCTCPLDVYTCRTTDFACPVSPAMHRDVTAMVDGGYTAEEIIAAFEDVYGARVLMAPRAEGFNLVGYLAPYVATGGAAIGVAYWILRNMKRQRAAAAIPTIVPDLEATPDEVERIAEAMRRDR